MISASAVSTGSKRESRLVRELASLFGAEILEQSHKMSIAEMYAQAELMDDCISRLQAQAGKPVEAQRKVVQSLNDKAATALCKWLAVHKYCGKK